MRKRIVTIVLSLNICLSLLGGCAKKEESAVLENSTIEENAGEEADNKGLRSEENTTEEEVEEEAADWQEERTHESQHASTVLEDDNAVYFCGKHTILKWDKMTQETDVIWMSDKEEIKDSAYAYKDSHGILLEDKIYFIESWYKDPVNPLASEVLYALSVVNTDGSGYQEIERVSGVNHLLLLDGIVYFDYNVDSMALEGYVADADGNLMIDSGKVVTEPVNVPQGCAVLSYYNNGVRTLTPIESAYRFGYYLLWDENFNVCKVNPDTGEKELLPEELNGYNLHSWNSKGFLFYDYTNDGMYFVDNTTWEIKLLIENDNNINIIGMDEEYVYWQKYIENPEFEQYIYKRIDLETATARGIFALDAYEGVLEESPWYLMDISVLNNYIYYVGVNDYKYYLMRREIDMPDAEEIIGEALFDSGVGDIGTVETYNEVFYGVDNAQMQTGYIDMEYLIVDERFSGAAKINEIINADLQNDIIYEREMAADMEEWAADGLTSSLTGEVSSIYYFNERFISYTQRSYDYTGGAHGMPYWVPYNFDLETGEQLILSNIVANSEEEFKEIVTAQFEKMYEVDPGIYWEDAVDNVYEWTTLESPFYLKEDGLVIYYGPYDLAPYAAGFQEIVVPYDLLNLYIPLGE